MSLDSLDEWLTNQPDDDVCVCRIHDSLYLDKEGCPGCANDEAERRHDEQREERS